MRPRRSPGSGPPPEPPPLLAGSDRRAVLAALRERLGGLKGTALAPDRLRVLRLGLPAVDRTLPWGGLPRGCLHEVVATGEALADGAATGFCAALLGRLSRDGPVLWIVPRDDLFARGLVELGLPPSRLLVVRARRRVEGLWAFEEALRAPAALAAALAEIDGGASLIQTRRLQLAAEGSGAIGLLLRRDGGNAPPSAAVTRWRVGVAPSRGGNGDRRDEGPGAPRWRVELARCRGKGAVGAWTVEWRGGDWRQVEEDAPTRRGAGVEAGAVGVAAEPGDRPPRPARAGGRRR
ncbi:MAG TPA: hypothetical protein VFG47_07110 [Geminicoccaceae bacterium]|nr:hypothetical protein [Geminicoccaceae bacterium]